MASFRAGFTERTRGVRRSPAPFRPGVEVLEGREVPAGDVTATLFGTTLTVRGDSADNIVSISNDGLNYTVAGTATTINGDTNPATFSAASIATITFIGTAGNNSLGIDGARGIRINITGGDGNEITSLSNSTFSVLTFLGNGGNDSLTASGVNGTTLTFTGGDGNDAVTLDLATIRTATFTGNDGNDRMTATNSAINTTFSRLTFTGGNGNDTLSLGHDSIRNLTFNGNSGDDTLHIGQIPGENNFGTINFSGHDGINTVRIHNGFTRVTGLMRIANSAGDSITNFGEQSTDRITLGSLSVTNSTGNDALTAAGASFSVGNFVTISNGAGGSQTGFLSTNVSVGGLTRITNGDGLDIVQFGTGAVGTVNLHGVSISNAGGGSSTSFLAANNTLTSSLSVINTDGDDNFVTAGDSFTVLGSVRLSNGNGNNTAQFGSAKTVQVNGPVSMFSLAGTDTASFGVAGTTDILLGALTISNGVNGGPTTFDGRLTAINGALNLIGSDLTINGEIFSVGTSANIRGASSISLNASIQTTIRGLLNVTGGNLTFAGGSNQVKSVNFNGGDVTVNGWTTVASTLNVRSAAGVFTNNSILDVFGNVLMTGVQNAIMDGTSTFVGGNLTVNAGAGANTVILNKVSINGASNINASIGDSGGAAGADQVAVNDSDFGGNVIVRTGEGDDVLNLETLDSDQITTFHGTLLVDLGAGDDAGAIGRPFDPNDFISTDDRVTFVGGSGFDTMQMLTSNNLFLLFPTIGADLELIN